MSQETISPIYNRESINESENHTRTHENINNVRNLFNALVFNLKSNKGQLDTETINGNNQSYLKVTNKETGMCYIVGSYKDNNNRLHLQVHSDGNAADGSSVNFGNLHHLLLEASVNPESGNISMYANIKSNDSKLQHGIVTNVGIIDQIVAKTTGEKVEVYSLQETNLADLQLALDAVKKTILNGGSNLGYSLNAK